MISVVLRFARKITTIIWDIQVFQTKSANFLHFAVNPICQRTSYLPFGHLPFIHLLVHVPFGICL